MYSGYIVNEYGDYLTVFHESGDECIGVFEPCKKYALKFKGGELIRTYKKMKRITKSIFIRLG